MPIDPDQDRHRVIRTAHVVKGQIDFRLRCCPRFDYGRKTHTVQQVNAHVIEFAAEGRACPPVRLVGGMPLEISGLDGKSFFTLKAGEEVSFIFECVACGNSSVDVTGKPSGKNSRKRPAFGEIGPLNRPTKAAGAKWSRVPHCC